MPDNKKRVILIMRPPGPGRFSIEGLFEAIASELRNKLRVEIYVVGPRRSFIKDLICLRSMKGDIYHVTGDVQYLIPFLPRNKTILTIHDIGSYLYGYHGIKRWVYKIMWLELPLKVAKAITTVSETTKKLILENFNIDESRIEVIENCFNPIYRFIPYDFNIRQPTILQVGAKPNKNLPRVIEALIGIPCKLKIIGDLDDRAIEILRKSNVNHEVLNKLSVKDLAENYVNCDIVVFVSLHEGFGLPIIEAQASGRPVITSDHAPMCNVAGPGACLVSANDVSAIRSSINKIINDSEYRIKLVVAGLKNVEKYRPTTIAEKYHRLYDRLGVGN